MRLTSQGVRDLNGPAMDGRFNGRKSSYTCLHHTSPDYPVERRDETLHVHDRVTDETKPSRVSVFYCVACGERRWDELEDGGRYRVVAPA